MKHSELDEGFAAHEKHLWKVLAALSRTGYVVPPQDARDLIHDFYLEEWAGVVQRYDSTLSQFTTYLSAAFFRFARRRILRLQHWRQRTVDLEEAIELASTLDMPDEVIERAEEIGRIRTALRTLPAEEREIIYDFLTSGEPNERALARLHSITRYRLREMLANGLGRLLIELSGESDPATMDARVAKGLWVDGHSPHRVAALLGIGTPEVNTARLRFVAELMDSLRQFNHQSKPCKESHEPRSGDSDRGAAFCR